jgi:hypothetical protein
MAEAIAALAFAGNILQFLDAGQQFVGRAYTIAVAGSHSLTDVKELRHITEYFQPLLAQLNPGNNHHGTTTQSERQLAALSTECAQVVGELLQTLNNAGVDDAGRKMDQIITAFKLTWNRSKIQKLEEHIGKLRQQLAVQLLVSIKEHSVKALDQQEAILAQLKSDPRYVTDIATKDDNQQEGVALSADAPGTVILDYIRSRLDTNDEHEQLRKLKVELDRIVCEPHPYTDYGHVYAQDYPQIEMAWERREKIEAQILAALHYREMEDRESTIAEAYDKTLRWMFEDAPPGRKDTKFREWLQSNDQMYWITGKAGAGKSTLMKYISKFDGNSPGSLECQRHLQVWAGGKDNLVVASFYFWASGTSMEASQRGLFQSLLYQILQQRPDLIPRVAPRTWEASCLLGLVQRAYTENDLHAMLYSAIRELVQRDATKVCLFIDGLDEYHGDHQKIVSICQAFLKLPNMKMCVSSRPWIIFQDAFERAPNLMLQDLTYLDIKLVVESNLGENEGFKRLQLREPEFAESLMENITEKSSGVFLWVRLVVKSLLAGLSHDDRISDLQRRLNLLPPDLEKLYVAIVEDLDPFYFEHASQYFKLVQATSEPLDALLYFLADEEDPDFAINLPIHPMSNQERELRTATVRRRLNSRCKGLLEVGPQGKVQYLHRSVKDYISGSDVRLRIESAAGPAYDCHLRLCSANLAMIKCLGFDNYPGQQGQERQECAKQCLRAAAKVTVNASAMIRILGCLDKTMTQLESLEDLTRFHGPEASKLSPWIDHHYGTSFLAVTVRFGVVDYVRARAEAGCLGPDSNEDHDDLKEYPLAKTAQRDNHRLTGSRLKWFMHKTKLSKLQSRQPSDNIGRRKGTWPLLLDANLCDPVSLPMFRCLLERGADPNLVFQRDGATPWTELLANMLTSCLLQVWGAKHGSSLWSQWTPIVRLFMEHGSQLDDTACKMVLQRMHRTRTLSMDVDRVRIAFECAATGKDELGWEYLNGENDLRLFRQGRDGRSADKRRESGSLFNLTSGNRTP